MDSDVKDPDTQLLNIRGGLKDLDALLSSGSAATLSSLLYYLEDSQWLSPDVIEKNQFKQLNLLAAHAFRYSPYFRARMEQASLTPQDIASPEGFRKLPVMTRRDIQQAGDTLFCTEIPRAHMPWGKTATSGSTGEPVTVRKTAINNLFWQVCMMREHFWHKRDFMGKLMAIRASDFHDAPAWQQGWGNPVSLLFSSGAVQALPVNIDIPQQVQELLTFKPNHLLIYPSNLDAIITHCKKEKIAVTGIDHIWCHAETLPIKLRQKAEAFFGARVEDNYSSQEMGIMALECPDSGRYHVMSESVMLEVVDDNGGPCREGETGKVVATDLHNFTTPLIRYELGDYAETCAPCSCGRGLPTLKAFRGRSRNLIAKPGGIRHWPSIDLAEFSGIESIYQYQIIQHSLEDIELKLVAKPSLTAQQEAALRAYLHNAIEHPFPIRFTYFESRLPLPRNGKFEEFISYVK